MNNSQTAFAQAFDSIKSTTEYNSEWANGTGYMDGIVHDQSVIDEMGVGERVKFVDDLGRRAIGIKTRHGIAVVFERYIPEDGVRSQVIVSNVPHAVRPLLREGQLSANDIDNAVNEHINVAHLVERVCGGGRRRTA